MKKLINLSYILLITQVCIAQKGQTKKDSTFSYPITDTNTFKNGYSATIYFHRCQSQITISTVFSPSLDGLLYGIDSKYESCSKTIDNLYYYSNGKRELLKDEMIKFNKVYDKRIKVIESDELKELKKLSLITYLSGNVYFSGVGFSNVLIVKAIDFVKLKANSNNCVPGSIVTFENCGYKDAITNKFVVINKSLKLK